MKEYITTLNKLASAVNIHRVTLSRFINRKSVSKDEVVVALARITRIGPKVWTKGTIGQINERLEKFYQGQLREEREINEWTRERNLNSGTTRQNRRNAEKNDGARPHCGRKGRDC